MLSCYTSTIKYVGSFKIQQWKIVTEFPYIIDTYKSSSCVSHRETLILRIAWKSDSPDKIQNLVDVHTSLHMGIGKNISNLPSCLISFKTSICLSAGMLIWFPEELCSLQENLLSPPHPGPRPTGTLASLCEPGAECKLHLLCVQWHILECGCLDRFLCSVAQGSFYRLITGILHCG